MSEDNAKLIADVEAALAGVPTHLPSLLERCRAALSFPVASAQVPREPEWPPRWACRAHGWKTEPSGCVWCYMEGKDAALAERNANG
jgi:hypothetical protein